MMTAHTWTNREGFTGKSFELGERDPSEEEAEMMERHGFKPMIDKPSFTESPMLVVWNNPATGERISSIEYGSAFDYVYTRTVPDFLSFMHFIAPTLQVLIGLEQYELNLEDGADRRRQERGSRTRG